MRPPGAVEASRVVLTCCFVACVKTRESLHGEICHRPRGLWDGDEEGGCHRSSDVRDLWRASRLELVPYPVRFISETVKHYALLYLQNYDLDSASLESKI